MQTAELISRGTPAAPVRTGTDGGMNPTFLAAVKSHGGGGANIRTAVGTIPAHVNPPGEPQPETTTGSTMSLASAESRSAAAPRSSVQVASAGSSGGIGSFFGNLFGSKSESEPPAAARPEAPASKSKAAAAAKPQQTATAGAARPKPSEPEAKAAAKPQPAPQTQQASAAPRAQQATAEPQQDKPANSLLNGAQPTLATGGFDNRFGSWR